MWVSFFAIMEELIDDNNSVSLTVADPVKNVNINKHLKIFKKLKTLIECNVKEDSYLSGPIPAHGRL